MRGVIVVFQLNTQFYIHFYPLKEKKSIKKWIQLDNISAGLYISWSKISILQSSGLWYSPMALPSAMTVPGCAVI